ncbi:class I SAM-dependent methyltransferase [Chitinophaga caseinilytica]|uniref:Class I SAM-dependent methyltransferase n=1 Tax=Chitinophaga caseinilytica TaxID=2267521 RepID=A0ABZ2Z7F9_9BACT
MFTITPAGTMNRLFVDGPDASDYPRINDYFNRAYQRDPENFSREFESLRREHEAFHSLQSIAGYCCAKPFGYAGDFRLIDRLYTHYIGSGVHIARWDAFAQAQPAAVAVRNRKTYFIDLMKANLPANVLNVASGPARDVLEFFGYCPDAAVVIDCLEYDAHAINYAGSLLKGNCRVRFTQQNILTWKAEGTYEMVWSSGLFDYFTDGVFVRVLRKLLGCVAPGGQLVIGNFSDENPNRAFMEVGMQWFLHHRSPEQLIDLAKQAGAEAWNPEVKSEPAGVNLFLHLTKPA